METKNNSDGTIVVKYQHYWSNSEWIESEETIKIIDLLEFIYTNKN